MAARCSRRGEASCRKAQSNRVFRLILSDPLIVLSERLRIKDRNPDQTIAERIIAWPRMWTRSGYRDGP